MPGGSAWQCLDFTALFQVENCLEFLPLESFPTFLDGSGISGQKSNVWMFDI